MLMTSRHDHSGVTLIELLIGLSLIVTLLLLAVPAYQFWIRNVQIRNAAEGVLNGLQLARAEAVRRNALIEIVFAGSGWTISTVVGVPEIIQARSANEGSETATVTITPAGADRITFNGMGWLRAINGNGSLPITRFDVASTMVGTEIRVLRVIVGTGGVMKMCDPAVAAGDPRACP